MDEEEYSKEYLEALDFVERVEAIIMKDRESAGDLYSKYEFFLKVAWQGLMRIMLYYPSYSNGSQLLFYAFYAGYLAGQGHGIEEIMEDSNLDMGVWGDFFDEEE